MEGSRCIFGGKRVKERRPLRRARGARALAPRATRWPRSGLLVISPNLSAKFRRISARKALLDKGFSSARIGANQVDVFSSTVFYRPGFVNLAAPAGVSIKRDLRELAA